MAPNRRQREQLSGLCVRVCLIVADLNCVHILKIGVEIDLIKPIWLQTGLFASSPMPRPNTTNFRDRFGRTQQNPGLDAEGACVEWPRRGYHCRYAGSVHQPSA